MTTTTFLNTVKTLIDPAGFMPEIFDEPTAITPEADSLTGVTDPGFNVPDELLPSTYVIEAGETLRENGWNTLGQGVENVGQVMRSFGFDEAEDEIIGGPNLQDQLKEAKQQIRVAKHVARTWKDYNEYDPNNPNPTIRKIEEAHKNNDTKAINRFKATPVTTTNQLIHEETVKTLKDPNASTGKKIVTGVIDTCVQLANQAAKGVESKFIQIGNWTGWWDEMEPDAAEGPAFKGEFSSNPQTFTPIDFNSSFVTDAYQQQDAPGADLIAGEANQGMDSYQAQGGRYEVLA